MGLSRLFCIGLSTPEAKLFFLFWYYSSTILIILTYLTVYILTVDSTTENLTSYFMCSISGYKPECDVYKENVQGITQPVYYLDRLTTLMLSFINLSNLTFVVPIYDIKLAIKRFCLSRK